MTLDELAALLPNGFHDSYIRSIGLDYVNGVATLGFTIDSSSPDEQHEGPGTADITVILRGLKYFVIDAPETDENLELDDSLWVVDSCNSIDCDGSGKSTISARLMSAASKSKVANSFFVDYWNSFIHVVADEAELIWAREDAGTQ